MAGQQRPRFERQLRLQRDALLADAADEVVLGDIGNLEQPSLADQIGDPLAFRRRLGAGGAGGGELGVQLGQLQARDVGVVGADEEPRVRAEVVDLRFKTVHF